jgi:hypothetical protein
MKYHDIMESLMMNYLFEPWDTQTRLQLEYDFRSQCPGPYIITWTKRWESDGIPVYLFQFEDPVEETMWLLRWS